VIEGAAVIPSPACGEKGQGEGTKSYSPGFQAPHQLLPQIVGLPAHHELRLGLIDVPQGRDPARLRAAPAATPRGPGKSARARTPTR